MDISVIIPTYQPGDYLWKCLDSLCCQTFDSSRYEVILVLNGEKEPFFDALQRYIDTNNSTQFRLYYTTQSGVSNARNIGIDNASGRYFCFIDDDDWVSNTYLEHLFAAVKDKGVAFADIKYYYEDSDRYTESYISRVVEANRQKASLTLLDVRRLCSSACGKIISADTVGSVRFDLRYKISEDMFFMATISKDIESLSLASEDAIYYRRIRKKSATFKRKPIGKLIKNNLSLTKAMISVFLSAPRQYSFPFFFRQNLAIFKNLLRMIRYMG